MAPFVPGLATWITPCINDSHQETHRIRTRVSGAESNGLDHATRLEAALAWSSMCALYDD